MWRALKKIRAKPLTGGYRKTPMPPKPSKPPSTLPPPPKPRSWQRRQNRGKPRLVGISQNPTPAPSTAAPWSKRQTATKPSPVSESATASLPRTKQAKKRDTNPLPPNTVIRTKKPFTLKFQTASVKYKPSFPTASTRFIQTANGLKRKI